MLSHSNKSTFKYKLVLPSTLNSISKPMALKIIDSSIYIDSMNIWGIADVSACMYGMSVSVKNVFKHGQGFLLQLTVSKHAAKRSQSVKLDLDLI